MSASDRAVPAPRPRGGRAPARAAPLPRRSVLLGALALSGCGFTPALAPGGRGRFAIRTPETRAGVVLARRLEDRLGLPGPEAPYVLTAALETAPEAAAVDPAQVTTRVRLEADARFAVTEAATGREAATGTASSFTSYDATGTTVAEDAAARDAEDRLMAILADRIAARLLASNLP